MSESKMHLLKKAATDINADNKSSDRFGALMQAFELFSHETERLEGAYQSLKDEFQKIHNELEAANHKLKRKVAELDIMSAYLNSILTKISQGLVFIDLNGDVTTYNHAAEKMLSVSINEVLFNNFWMHFSDDLFGFSIREALGSKSPPPLSFVTIKDHKGNLRELEINTTFVAEDPKTYQSSDQELSVRRMEGIIVLIRDVTEIRKLQEVANRNTRLKELGEMAAMVAHEIRNPLGGIRGFAALLRRDLKAHPESMQMADYIIEGTDTLNRLVTNVLNYTRPIEIKTEPTDITAMLKELKKHIDADCNTNDQIKIAIKSSLSQKDILVDAQLIKSAILNLIVNARQAMPEGGLITVKVYEDKHQLIIEIIDQGEGISEGNLAQIFSPFFTTKKEGNGFGLTEVLKVIQAHEGTIDVASTVGEGTTFTLRLPIKSGVRTEHDH